MSTSIENIKNTNKIKKLCKTVITEPSGWNKVLWLRIEFGLIVPFAHRDSVIGVYCCHDNPKENGGVFELLRKSGLVKEYSVSDLCELFRVEYSKIKCFDDMYNMVYDHLYELIIDAYGLNGWFCKYNGIKPYNIVVKEPDPNLERPITKLNVVNKKNTNKSPQYYTHDITPGAITVSFKHTPKYN
ncbi:putative ORFan [Tupanvirus deep ocean]|uniref:ORFan n=2 Tax=Tupanvirus TaxID=2094720 RepID=A0AC62A9H6_9VIRU|nr:putative ORFan [Tupanvirus deep ocean]QKU34432.1 putative ORFan [Tupanvirus deep ocean]